MSKLVERLRHEASLRAHYGDPILEEAADEIERLLAQLPEEAPTWRLAGKPEDSIELPDGTPVADGTTLYTFDERGTWFYDVPLLPSNDKRP